MPAGGELTVQTVNSSSFADPVIVEIIDSGKGIPQEHLSQIFDPFFTTKSPGEGTGIGLSVCKDIVERHSGTISVESKLNQGTKFIIRFPIQEGAS
jgi:signal transduction histidine kinase